MGRISDKAVPTPASCGGDPRRGYRGSYTLVRDYLGPPRVGVFAADPAPQPPKARKVTSWIMSHPDNLNRGTRRQLAAMLAACPELAAVQAHVAAFADLIPSGADAT